jgi:phage-related protein
MSESGVVKPYFLLKSVQETEHDYKAFVFMKKETESKLLQRICYKLQTWENKRLQLSHNTSIVMETTVGLLRATFKTNCPNGIGSNRGVFLSRIIF